MIEQLEQIFLRGGTDKKVFRAIYPDITESNRRNLVVYASIAAAGMLCMVLATFPMESLRPNRLLYFAAAAICAVLALVSRLCKKEHPTPIYLCVYAFVAALYGFGIAMGTYMHPEFVSVSFPVLLFAVPQFFTDIPLRMNAASLVSIVCYYIAARFTQSAGVFEDNLASIIPYGIISIILSAFMMRMKIHRYALEYENRFLIESDQLTGMLNRRCYEQQLQHFRENGTAGVMICAFDINGLKQANDNLGHHAGDELIRGAADCIEGVFGKYGRCYRTGGDEFMAIIEGPCQTAEELKQQLDRRCACFKGTYVSGLSISAGMVRAEGGEPVDELVKLADKKMYEDKRRYYEMTGHDRRARR